MIALTLLMILISAGIAMVLVHLFRLLATPRDLTDAINSAAEFSSERYRPMLRLVDGSDLTFLKSHPAATPKMVARLRKQHVEAFRSYVSCLETDFQAVCWAIKTIMLQSQTDRPDLAAMLLRSQVAFAFCLLKIQLRVVLYSYGIGTVSVAGLLQQFDGMRLELRTLTPVAMSSAA